MKRSWFGFALLVILLAVSLAVSLVMTGIHEPIAGQLRLAAGFAQMENWQEARELTEEATALWKKWEGLRLCFADHTPVEQINSDLAQIPVMDRQELAAACAQTAEKVEAIAKNHHLHWWNLL